MATENEIVRILREEYGIKNADDLDRALKSIKFIDLSPFCGSIKKMVKKEK